MKYIYLIVGRSGSGKSTAVDYLTKKYGYDAVCSYTTRPPRKPGETGHYFVTDEEFNKMKMVAYTLFNGYQYGVTAEIIDNSDLYVIDIPGVEFLKIHYNGKPIKVIDLRCPREELARRMASRGDTQEAIRSRLENDDKMFEQEHCYEFDAVVDASRPIVEVAEDIENIIEESEKED